MRKIIILCGCIMLSAIHLYGQTASQHNNETLLEGGVKVDATFFNFQKADAPNAESILTPGLTLGGFMDIWFKERIGIRPELNLNFKRTVFGWKDNSGQMLSFGIEVPIYVVTRFELFGKHCILVGLGPYTEFSCYARWMIDGRNVDLLKIHEGGAPMIQDTQSGFGVVFGYEFGNGIGIEASYKLCYYNILQPNTSQGVSLYPQSISIGLTCKIKNK